MRLFLICAVLMLTARSFAVCDEWTMGPDKLPFKSIGALHDGAWEMKANGYLGTFVVVPKPGRVVFCVRAAGKDAVMHIHVGDRKFVHSVNRATFEDYRSACILPVGTHAVRFELVNVRPGLESVLRVKQVQVVGTGIKPPDTRDMDALALKAADSYIENYRKGNVEVALVGTNGKPVPAGTAVHVKLRRHAFNFGTALFGTNVENGYWLTERPAVGSDAFKYQEFVKTHFNMIVPENAGKWAFCENTRDVETMGFVDMMLAFAQKNGIKARMHCVLWGQSSPKWVENLLQTAIEAPDSATRDAAKAELRKEITERINCLVRDRAGSYVELDGINEEVHQDGFLKAYGHTGLAGIYDEILSASNGRARVYFNEFNLFQWVRGFGYTDDYVNWYKDHIEKIIHSGISSANRTKIGIGMQYYPNNDDNARKYSPHSAAKIAQVLHSLSVFEYPLSLTEFAVAAGSEDVAPRFMAETMRLVFGNDQATSFLVWGFWHKQMWAKGSAMVDDNWNLTECGKTYQQLMGIRNWGLRGVPVWTTDLNIKAGRDGKVNFRGFYGEYDITVGGKTHKMTLEPRKTTVRMSL